jgi:hypothetical protein
MDYDPQIASEGQDADRTPPAWPPYHLYAISAWPRLLGKTLSACVWLDDGYTGATGRNRVKAGRIFQL